MSVTKFYVQDFGRPVTGGACPRPSLLESASADGYGDFPCLTSKLTSFYSVYCRYNYASKMSSALYTNAADLLHMKCPCICRLSAFCLVTAAGIGLPEGPCLGGMLDHWLIESFTKIENMSILLNKSNKY